MPAPSRVLVTGAAGFIGSHSIEALLAHGFLVLGVDNLRTGKIQNLAHAFKERAFNFEQLDVSDTNALGSLMRRFKPDSVLHLSAMASISESWADPQLCRHLNVKVTDSVFRTVCRDGGIRRFVFASSAAVYGSNPKAQWDEWDQCAPISPYGRSKLDAEKLLLGLPNLAGGLIVRCHRYFNVYGPRQCQGPPGGVVPKFVAALMRDEPMVIDGDGLQCRDFIHVSDVARANLQALMVGKLQTGVANICTGIGTSINELAEIVRRSFGKYSLPEYRPGIEVGVRRAVGSISVAKEQLGFVARVKIAEGIRSCVPTRSLG